MHVYYSHLYIEKVFLMFRFCLLKNILYFLDFVMAKFQEMTKARIGIAISTKLTEKRLDAKKLIAANNNNNNSP